MRRQSRRKFDTVQIQIIDFNFRMVTVSFNMGKDILEDVNLLEAFFPVLRILVQNTISLYNSTYPIKTRILQPYHISFLQFYLKKEQKTSFYLEPGRNSLFEITKVAKFPDSFWYYEDIYHIIYVPDFRYKLRKIFNN